MRRGRTWWPMGTDVRSRPGLGMRTRRRWFGDRARSEWSGERLSARGTSHPPSQATQPPDCRALAIDHSADDLQLGHFGGLDVLNTDLGGELLDDPQEVRAGGRARGQGLLDLSLVAGLSQEDVQGHFAQEGDAHLL